MTKQIFYFDSQLNLTDSDESPRIEGYAMKYGVVSHDRGGYRVQFRKGCFDDVARFSDALDVRAYYDHDETKYLARTANGTLRIEDDEIGLKFSLDIPDTSLGRDVRTLMQRGDIPGCSFGYIPGEWEWLEEYSDTSEPLQIHTKGRLFEVSVVHDPSFPNTEARLAASINPLEEYNAMKDRERSRAARKRNENRLRLAVCN